VGTSCERTFQRLREYKYRAAAKKVSRQLDNANPPDKSGANGKGGLYEHKHLIMNWPNAKGLLSSGAVDGLSLEAKLTN
jgi:hypothetical protein